MKEYNIKDHGDSLEKEYSEFIQAYFNTYESVWRLYIGNKGNDTKASIDGYSPDREEKRQSFSEHTYTILQSVILLDRLVKNEVFSKGHLSNTKEVLDLQDCLLLFFTHLGRIRDNVEEASTCLLFSSTKEITKILDEFYYKRHIVVHGKMIPILYKSNGEILIPILSKNNVDISGWNHKFHKWPDAVFLPTKSLALTIENLFSELLPKLVDIFGRFKTQIQEELNSSGLKLKFEINVSPEKHITTISGSRVSDFVVDAYGLANYNPNKSK